VIVKVQAVVMHDGALVVVRERRRGFERIALPGGRVHDRESVADALIRGVTKTTRLDIEPVRLMYVAEIPGLYAAPDLHLVWLAELCVPETSVPRSLLVGLGADDLPALDPPIMSVIAADAEEGWPEAPKWLSYVEPRRMRRVGGGLAERAATNGATPRARRVAAG
jgi:ADP-ribose pyrophosphatase YjhB (NUDIX family)